MISSPDARALHALWAKAGAAPGASSRFHPLVCHSLDVAAVARTLLEKVLPPVARHIVADGLGLSLADVTQWVALLAALHDTGKASPAFQAKVPALADWLREIGLPFPRMNEPVPHGTITTAVLNDLLVQRCGLPRPAAFALATITGGHHGFFPDAPSTLRVPLSALGGPAWTALRALFLDGLIEVLEVAHAPLQAPPHPVSIFLAGLVAVADWIASNIRHFDYAGRAGGAPVPIDLPEYWEAAGPRADAALTALGWNHWRASARPIAFQQVFPLLRPRPVQEAVEFLTRSLEDPALVILEAPMGEGKTEAAMYLAEHWAAATSARGAYFALPTQATSNQMFVRVRDFLSRRRAERITLQLVHGRAALSADLLAMIEKSEVVSSDETACVYDEDADDDGHVVAAEWFTYRKRGLLSEFGVGTVDQALLGALQTRHVFVRLFGLAHKVVILDEVHAYDTYMTSLLERLLEWLAALRSPVLVLSATLPAERRQSLLRAYAQGLGLTGAPAVQSASYPRLTWLSNASVGAQHVPIDAASTREVRLRAVDGRLAADGTFALGHSLRAALAGGGCAVVICNTVRRAQQVYRALAPHFGGAGSDGAPMLDLLHARFTFEDREERERRVLRRFGRAGDARPETAVLVATQIVEQSLDLDFDLLVTDLAPADLILQRLGRLHRHRRGRPAALAEPEVWLCMPPVDESGCPIFEGGDCAVYAGHVLLRSWLGLRDRSALTLPADIEALVEEVYGAVDFPSGVPPALRTHWLTTAQALEQERQRHRIEAESRWLGRPSSPEQLWRFTRSRLAEDAPEFHAAHQALTRLAEPTVDVVLLHESGGGPSLTPGDSSQPVELETVPDSRLTSALLRRSVAIGDQRVVHELLRRGVPRGWRGSALLRRHRPLLLDSRHAAQVRRWTIRYERELGILIGDEDISCPPSI